MKQLLTATLSILLLVLIINLEPAVSFITQAKYGSIHTISISPFATEAHTLPQEAFFTAAETGGQYESLLFTGDVLLARNVEVLMERLGNDFPFAGIDFHDVAEEPAVIGNFESAVPVEHKPTPAFALTFSTSESQLAALEDAAFTHVSIANNHLTDFGVQGLLNTVHTLTENDLTVFGAATGVEYDDMAVISTKYAEVAIVGLDDTDGNLKKSTIKNSLRDAKKRSEIQIVYVHWGIEYDGLSSKRQQRLAKEMVSYGADLVIGHHPHVVQEIGLIDGVPIVYSLGNYIFDQYFDEEVQTGLIAVLEFEPAAQVRLVPVESYTQLSQPREVTGDKKASFLYELAQRSDFDLENTIKRGVLPLESLFTSAPKVAMMSE